MRKRLSRESPISSFRSLFKESDKGFAILVGTMIEESLRRLHEAHILATASRLPNKFFEQLSELAGSPLSTFCGKTQLAYAYGLISREDYDDLDIIRKVRNEAAHSIYEFSLEDPGVKALVLRLKTSVRANLTNESIRNLSGFSEAKRHLMLNGTALFILLCEKCADAMECGLQRGKPEKRAGPGPSK